ncbi:MAG: type II/IV secretion system ATPase subunit [Nanoarchaeota archaeon]|nr:type II/IV secretion system ATPase subunit [Nanoarchaeota archaeon]
MFEKLNEQLNQLFKKKEAVKEGKKEETVFKIDFSSNQKTVNFPESEDKSKIDFRYPLIIPYAYSHIVWDEVQSELIYKIEEPILDQREKETLVMLEQGVKEFINMSFIAVKEKETLIEFLEKNVQVLLRELNIDLDKNSYLKIMYYIYRDFIGLNKIEPLMNDIYIEDIECNGKNSPVYIVHRRYGNIRTNIVYKDFDELTSFVEKLAQKCGRFISYSTPIVDGVLPSGDRVNATYTEDVSSKGPTFTLRKFSREPWSPMKLMQAGSISPEILAYLWLLVENGSNILVVGGTGSGKTSFINGLAFFIPPEDRIVSIEDSREIRLEHENWLPSVARAGIGAGEEKAGEVTMFDLLRSSFRQRPDYIIVGEIRGQEANVLFQAMAAGHASMATMHANDVKTVIRRLQTPPINLSPSLVEILDVICLMTFAKIKGADRRKLSAIQEILSVSEGGNAVVNVPFKWDPMNDVFLFKKQSNIFDKIVIKKGISIDRLWKEFDIRKKLLIEMYRKKIFEFSEVQKIIHAYYRTPQKVLKEFGLIK